VPVTLLALFRAPDGGDEALATFMRRYRDEHLPLMRAVPGLRSMSVERVTADFDGAGHVLANHMTFDDRSSLDAAMQSQEMRAAGRNVREIAPGLMTLVVLEPEVEAP